MIWCLEARFVPVIYLIESGASSVWETEGAASEPYRSYQVSRRDYSAVYLTAETSKN